jgi:hypothetical protein
MRWSLTPKDAFLRFTPARLGLLRSPFAAFLSAVVALTAIWIAAGPNSVAEISGDARYYLALWREPRQPTAPPFTYRVLTPWLARLSGLDAFWAFALVTIVSLAIAGVLLWAVVLRDRTPQQAWLALGLFVVSPAAVYSLADHYLVDPLADAFLAGVLFLLQRKRMTLAAAVCVVGLLAKEPVLFAGPIVVLLALRARAWPAVVLVLTGAPALYLVLHRTNWIANGAGREFPYFTEGNLSSVVNHQGGALRAILIALVVGFGPLAVAAALGWRSSPGVLRVWALLLIPIALAVVIAGDWIRMLAYSAVVFAPIAAQDEWSPPGAALTLAATAVSSIGVQKMPKSWLQVLAGAAILVLYTVLMTGRRFWTPPLRDNLRAGR